MGAYRFVPAGIFPGKKSGVVVYVKYGNNNVNNLVVRHHNDYIWIVAPDRELVIVEKANRTDSFRPMGCNFDEMVVFGPTMPQFDGYGIEYMMTNYTPHVGHDDKSPRHRVQGFEAYTNPCQPRSTWLADSGGYQLGIGTMSFIDVLQLTDWYSANTDLGMVVDIPVSAKNHGNDLFDRAAELQARNTGIIMDNKAEHLELINIVHGSTTAERSHYHNIVKRPDITRLAIAGDYNGTIMDVIHNLVKTMEDDNGFYKHYHLLGIFNPRVTSLLAKVAAHGNQLITSDSSTAIQAAAVREYMTVTQDKGLHRIGIGRNCVTPNINNVLPCSCQLCTTVKYADVLGTVDSGSVGALLTTHNMFAMDSYMRMLDTYAHTMTTKEYKDYLARTIAKRGSGGKEMLACVDFIDKSFKQGVSSAKDEFKFYHSGGLGINSMSSLTGTPTRDWTSYKKHITEVMDNFDRAYKGEDLSHLHCVDTEKAEKMAASKARSEARKKGAKIPTKKRPAFNMVTTTKKRANT